ncbi:MAG: hypothetical protein DRI84_09855 [Bacteroidetes bacterium]|nr:MAG: hypothetical protein DRI84_09855 [Bacteroidota bacterium]
MSTKVELSEEKFNDFLRCLTNLKEVCNDVDIRDGFIRQRSNDKTSVFEIDMTPVLNTVNMAISDIKRKLDLLKTFAGQKIDLEIFDGDPGYFTFADSYSSLKFISPSLQYIDNKYMTEDELERIFVMNDEELICEHDLTSMITERIRVVTQSFNTDSIQVLFEGETASIKAATQAKDQFANFVTGITTNMILEDCSALLSTIPFGIDHDTDVEFKMFKDVTQDISLNKFETNLGDINMKILTRSAIVKDED